MKDVDITIQANGGGGAGFNFKRPSAEVFIEVGEAAVEEVERLMQTGREVALTMTEALRANER
jgi:hypothetical protein